MLVKLALASLAARRLTVGFTVLAIALSVALFLAVEKVRSGARASFADTISGTDLIVGARSGSVQLLLYSVFRIGNATNNMSWDSYQTLASRPEVDWIVPISLGDSHFQFRVMGTTNDFFERYRFRADQGLRFAAGREMQGVYEAVIGADVAREMGYAPGDPMVISHGISSFIDHEDSPFRLVGILAKTGTPVDRTVIVSLDAIEAIHRDWRAGAQALPEPQAITAALVGVKSRLQIFGLQRWINEYPEEPLLAVLPGIALQELWQIVGIAETALIGVSVMVVATALLGMCVMLLSGLEARRREIAIFRAMGARPGTVLLLLMLEAFLTALAGVLAGGVTLYAGLLLARPWIDSAFGLWLPIHPPDGNEIRALAAILLAGLLSGLVPAWRAYRQSLSDGMTLRH